MATSGNQRKKEHRGRGHGRRGQGRHEEEEEAITGESIDDGAEDKFAKFERWLRVNGAQFPLLELRRYDPPPGVAGDGSGGRGGDCDDDDDDDDDDSSEEDEDGAEEKKDCDCGIEEGGGVAPREQEEEDDDGGGDAGESESVARMSLGGTTVGTAVGLRWTARQNSKKDKHLRRRRRRRGGGGVGGGKDKNRTEIQASVEEEEEEGGDFDGRDYDDVSQDPDDEYDDGSREMRGVHARSYIPPHTVCVSIPKSCLITVEMGQSTPIGRKVLSGDLDLDAPKHIFLMIYLLWDMKVHGGNSFFAPYYDMLPKRLRNMPIFWDDDELRCLEGSYLLVQISDRIQAIREDYDAICSVAPEFASVATLSEFQWARMIVCSRNFGLLVNGHRTSALVPHADMLNHLRPRETKWTFCEESQCFTITTLQGIGAGEQVYDSYGQKCNHRFLLNYGFCVEDNVEVDGFCPNEVSLELSMDVADVVANEDIRFEERGRGGGRGGPTANSGTATPPTSASSTSS